MSKFNLYIIREILFTFLYIVILLTGILWIGQGLRHIELLTTDNISFTAYLSYILMLLPKVTNLTIPISSFLSVLISLNKIRTDSELIILWASGEKNSSIILKPVLFLFFFIFLLMLFSTLVITPYSLNEIRDKIVEIRSSGINSSILQEKKFVSPTDTLTIFIQNRKGNEIENLLIHDLKDSSAPQTYIAQKGEFISDNEVKILRLYNGNIQIFNKSERRISEIDFETYDLDLSPYNKDASSHRYPDELFTHEIINNLKGKSLMSYDREEVQQFAELNNRIISPLYLMCIVLLPILSLNYLNTPNKSWLIPISLISILAILIKVIEISLSNILINNNNLVYINYCIPVFLFFVLMTLIIFENPIKIFKKNAIET